MAFGSMHLTPHTQYFIIFHVNLIKLNDAIQQWHQGDKSREPRAAGATLSSERLGDALLPTLYMLCATPRHTPLSRHSHAHRLDSNIFPLKFLATTPMKKMFNFLNLQQIFKREKDKRMTDRSFVSAFAHSHIQTGKASMLGQSNNKNTFSIWTRLAYFIYTHNLTGVYRALSTNDFVTRSSVAFFISQLHFFSIKFF